jgi:hypothetical protein
MIVDVEHIIPKMINFFIGTSEWEEKTAQTQKKKAFEHEKQFF